jgi:hypothetical protein
MADRHKAEEAIQEAARRFRESQEMVFSGLSELSLLDRADRVMSWLARGMVAREAAAEWARSVADEARDEPSIAEALSAIERFEARIGESSSEYLYTARDMASWSEEFLRNR